jgi:hypothetical protein
MRALVVMADWKDWSAGEAYDGVSVVTPKPRGQRLDPAFEGHSTALSKRNPELQAPELRRLKGRGIQF